MTLAGPIVVPLPDLLLGTYNYLDLTPQGSPRDPAKPWLRLHDEY